MRSKTIAAAALAATLGLVSFSALADDTMPPQGQTAPQQTAQMPATPDARMPVDENTVPPWSALRNGGGAVLDPATGTPDNYHADHDGNGG